MPVRRATTDDIPALTRVINRAYVVEAHLFHGDRTDEAEVREHMERPAFYTLFGYVASGSTPYASAAAKVPVRMVRMTKPL